MKKKRHKTEEIIRIIRKADSDQTFYRWRRKYGRMEMADAKRFKELVNENGELKHQLNSSINHWLRFLGPLQYEFFLVFGTNRLL